MGVIPMPEEEKRHLSSVLDGAFDETNSRESACSADDEDLDFSKAKLFPFDDNLSAAFEKVLREQVPDLRIERDSETGQLQDDLRSLLNDPRLSDVMFTFGPHRKEHIFAHRCVLACRSAVFAAMLQGPMKESRESTIHIPFTSSAVFLHLLEYIYTGSVRVAPERAIDLVFVADMYGLRRLVETCLRALFARVPHTVDTIAVFLELSNLVDCTDIQTDCLRFVAAHSVEFLESSAFAGLSEDMVRLVTDQCLDIDNELRVYLALSWWLDSCCSRKGAFSRRIVAPRVLSNVRLPLIFDTVSSESDLDKIRADFPKDTYAQALQNYTTRTSSKVRNVSYEPRRKTCRRCAQKFLDATNNDKCCRFHADIWFGAWLCCEKTTKSAQGCQHGPHSE